MVDSFSDVGSWVARCLIMPTNKELVNACCGSAGIRQPSDELLRAMARDPSEDMDVDRSRTPPFPRFILLAHMLTPEHTACIRFNYHAAWLPCSRRQFRRRCEKSSLPLLGKGQLHVSCPNRSLPL